MNYWLPQSETTLTDELWHRAVTFFSSEVILSRDQTYESVAFHQRSDLQPFPPNT